jgi:hypothetical protein
MYELCKANAEMCLRMAAACQVREVREQFTELAERWRSKADALRATAATQEPPNRSPPTSPAETPLPPTRLVEAVVFKAPALDIALVPNADPSSVPHEEQSELDMIWQAIQPAKPAPNAVRKANRVGDTGGRSPAAQSRVTFVRTTPIVGDRHGRDGPLR